MSKNGPYAKNGFTFCDKIECDDSFIAIFQLSISELCNINYFLENSRNVIF